MRLSKHALTVLNAQYRSVLKKCLLINAGLLFCATGVMAEDYVPTDNTAIEIGDKEDKTISNVQNVKVPSITVGSGANLLMNGTRVIVGEGDSNNGTFFVNGTETNRSAITLENNSSLDFSDGEGYASNVRMNYTDLKLENSEMPIDGKLELNNSTFDLSYDDKAYSDYQVEVYDLTLDNSTATISDERVPDSTLAAKNNLNINSSNVTLTNNAVLAWNGQVYEEDGNGNDVCVGVQGEVNIKDSTLTLEDKAKLSIGADDDEGADKNQAKLNISHSTIELNGEASVEFHKFNKENTTISNDTVITMNDDSSMSLNGLQLTDSTIIMNDKSSLNVTDVKLENSAIKANNNTVKFNGEVNFSGLFDPATAEVDGNLTRGGYDDEITYNLNSGTLKYANDMHLYDAAKHTHAAGESGRDKDTNAFADGKYALNSINLKGGTLDIANGKASEIKLAKLSLSKNSNIALDADLANETMDRFSDDTTVDGSAKLNITKLNLVSDAKNEETKINFTQDGKLLAATDYTGATSGLRALSPIYSYDVAYDKASGDFTFTRGAGSSAGDYNPSVYVGSVVGQTLATIQSTIAQTAFSSLNNTLPQKDNAWVSVIGFDDTVDMKSFNNVDSEMYSVVGGVNSDVKHFEDFDATYGLYAGYINSEQKYDGNTIDQNGGYIGLNSVLNKGNAELLATIDTGYIRNEDKHSYGTDKFDTYFTGVAVKAGYTYNFDNGLSVVPSLYAGYTFVNNEDYTSKSGTKIKNDNLHLFEVAPGVKVNKDFNNGWTGYAQAKYAFIMDNGGDADIDNINLPNISAKDYVEYGLGANKTLDDNWSLAAEINRRDGGREGWNGNLNIKYNF